ncbi:MAG: acetyl-CoA carboxylase biotin carboxyl carrier protein subunit [Terriglobia bacterium]
MYFEVTLAGRTHRVELRRRAEGWDCTLDARPLAADVVELRPGVFSILIGGPQTGTVGGGQAFEIQVERAGDHYRVHSRGRELTATVADPRRWQRRATGVAAAGRQEVQAPMPGKVITVLVAAGQRVEAGQGLVVVEAMKMQNEIPAPRGGVVEGVLVAAGDAVEHGQPLVVVT